MSSGFGFVLNYINISLHFAVLIFVHLADDSPSSMTDSVCLSLSGLRLCIMGNSCVGSAVRLRLCQWLADAGGGNMMFSIQPKPTSFASATVYIFLFYFLCLGTFDSGLNVRQRRYPVRGLGQLGDHKRKPGRTVMALFLLEDQAWEI